MYVVYWIVFCVVLCITQLRCTVCTDRMLHIDMYHMCTVEPVVCLLCSLQQPVVCELHI